MHHEVGSARHFGPCLPHRLRIAVAKFGPHVLAANKGRIADDELRFRPPRAAGVGVAIGLYPRGLVRHGQAGDGVGLDGESVPRADGASGSVAPQFTIVPGQHRILMADVARAVQHRLADGSKPTIVELPFQVADP